MDSPGLTPHEGQPPGLDAPPSGTLVTHQEAARYLGVSPRRVAWLVLSRHLSGSRYGITADTLRREMRWRATASPGQQVRRVLADAARMLAGVLRGLLDGL